jgi:two-component sensor histidine kinase
MSGTRSAPAGWASTRRMPRSSRPELVANAVQHARDNGAQTIGVTLTHSASPAAVTIVVSDSSPRGPVRRDTPAGSEQGRGLQIVEALSAHWGWRCGGGRKVVFAVLAREG